MPGCCDSCAHGQECAAPSELASPIDESGDAISLRTIAADLEAPIPDFVPGTVNVAEKLGLASQEVTASKAVSVEGSNAVRVDILVVNLTLASVSFRVQVSNDAVCWSDAAQFRKTTIGYATTKVRGIGFRFVRLFYEASNTAGGEGVLAASLHHWRN
ncbi:MAG: hypothetical protein AAB074_22460 [Planctomycetota bacterium]